MDFELSALLEQFLAGLRKCFPGRLEFAGLQGSWKRGEATAESDIDLVVVLDEAGMDDLSRYREYIHSLPIAEKACGFICGRRELLSWPRYDLFQLRYDTLPLWGNPDELFPIFSESDAREAVRIGAASLYHAACHRFLYDGQPAEGLAGLCKSAFFILQALSFLETGEYPENRETLASRTDGVNREILQLWEKRDSFPTLSPAALERWYGLFISWCGDLLYRYAE